MKFKSIGYNSVLNIIKTLSSILFPLITLPYINRVLQIDNVGKISFSLSYINYFILIAGLGIATYAVREGGKLRGDVVELSKFTNQVFSINIVATIVSYSLLFFSFFIFSFVEKYEVILYILSLNILGATLSISWFFSIVEDYMYVTVRTIIIQIISVVLMFLFVKDINDVYIYAFILVFSTSIISLLNLIYIRKYISLRLTLDLELKKHLKPILILFLSSIAITIYVNSDITMLGIISGDYYTGIYSVSVKVYTILKTLLTSIFIVSLSRLSYYIASNKNEEYNSLVKTMLSFVILMVLPIIVGIILLSEEIILVIAGENYSESVFSLKILSVAILPSLLATYFSISILLPLGKDKVILVATIVGASINILLNIVFLPLFNDRGAALTTLISEILVVLLMYPRVKKYISIDFGIVFKSAFACLGIFLFIAFIKGVFADALYFSIISSTFGSVIIYILILILLRTKEIDIIISKLINKS